MACFPKGREKRSFDQSILNRGIKGLEGLDVVVSKMKSRAPTHELIARDGGNEDFKYIFEGRVVWRAWGPS